MANSIMQIRKECYICRLKYNVMTTTGLEEHHVLNGPLRKKAEYYGLKVWLCHRHHKVADFLTVAGCNEMQGFYYYKPMPSEGFSELLDSMQ